MSSNYEYQFVSHIYADHRPSTIPDVAFSPDGKWFAATFKEGNQVRLYEAQTNSLSRVFDGADSLLDWPHGLTMTNRHLIVSNKHAMEQPSTFLVYRIEGDTTCPCTSFTTPIENLREAHSIAIHDDIMIAAYCGKGKGAIISYQFNDETGEISGPIDIRESMSNFTAHVEPKGICFNQDGTRVLVTLSTEKPKTFLENVGRAVRLLGEDGGIRYIINRIWNKARQLLHSSRLNTIPRYYNGIVAYAIDMHGFFSKEPLSTHWVDQFSRLENICIHDKLCAIPDAVNDAIYFYEFDGENIPNEPVQVMRDHLSFPHDVCISPDGGKFVVANYGLDVKDSKPVWGKFRDRRGGMLTVYKTQAEARSSGPRIN